MYLIRNYSHALKYRRLFWSVKNRRVDRAMIEEKVVLGRNKETFRLPWRTRVAQFNCYRTTT